MTATRCIVEKLWNYWDTKLGSFQYMEQLTYLLFLKLQHEQTNQPHGQGLVPYEGLWWDRLVKASIIEIDSQYTAALSDLRRKSGTIGIIFRQAENQLNDPLAIHQLVQLIDGERWSTLSDTHRELLIKAALKNQADLKPHLTPEPLIRCMVDLLRPLTEDTVADPSCGFGNFLIFSHMNVGAHLQNLSGLARGVSFAPSIHGATHCYSTARLATMNLFTHAILSDDDAPLVELKGPSAFLSNQEYSVVLSNPPFGRNSSHMCPDKDSCRDQQGFSPDQSGPQNQSSDSAVNFLEHVMSSLATNGRAAIIVPDGVLFSKEGAERVRRKLLKDFNFHTMLRLPTGIFHRSGKAADIRANVLFFEKKVPREYPWTESLWVYDLRTDKHFTPKRNPIRSVDFDDFAASYALGQPITARKESPRFRAFNYEELTSRLHTNFDISWPQSIRSFESPSKEVFAEEVNCELSDALSIFDFIITNLDQQFANSQNMRAVSNDSLCDPVQEIRSVVFSLKSQIDALKKII